MSWLHHRVSRRLVGLLAGSSLIGCGSGGALPADAGDADTDADGAIEAAPRAPDAAPDAVVDRDAGPDSSTIVWPDAGTFTELPRLSADPALTRRIASGSASFVGYGPSSCSHGLSGERWCAFSRPSAEAGAGTELWVANVGKAITGLPIDCDASGPDCIRLTSNLFTTSQFEGPFHPYGHRFDGDLLIYYAEVPLNIRDPYMGPVWGWRPGWAKARQLTTSYGGLCYAQHRADVVFCSDSVFSFEDPAGGILSPHIVRRVDLLAGPIGQADDGPLAQVAHLAIGSGGNLHWRAGFDQKGQTFAFSHTLEVGGPEVLEAIKTADIGTATPTTIVTGAAEWEIAHDGTKVYFLRGLDRDPNALPKALLMMADFPSGENAVTLRPEVGSFARLGARGEVFSDLDKGLAFYNYVSEESWTYSLMLDRSKPSDVFTVGLDPRSPKVANDARHTVYSQMPAPRQQPVGFVQRSDRSGNCIVTHDPGAETYGTDFTDSGRWVFWIEYGRADGISEEGWYARPEDCGTKTKYGDYVTEYRLVGDDFVVFDGGSFDDQITWLQYTPLVKDGTATPPSPTIIVEHPDTVSVMKTASGTFVLYTISDTARETGIYVFGPLPAQPPQ